MSQESPEARIKRLKMRSMRRGIKEMDIILSSFCDAKIEMMSDAELRQYDALLAENDQDLYQWVSGQAPMPPHFKDLITEIRSFTLQNPRTAAL
ncbi:MAG: succinate dehydrogenase assembly factor 2 [Mangrovicoccus sp.]